MISVIVPTCRPTSVLTRCLVSLAQQQLPSDELEVCVVFNGDAAARLECGPWPFRLSVTQIGGASAAAARNRGLACTSGELVVFLNDDVVLEPGCLAAHAEAHARLDRPGLVLGSATWPLYADSTVLDRLIAETSLVMFYDQMRPYEWYGFRHAWTLNLSVKREYAQRERFDERLSPVNFEDLEWAFRLERRCGLHVWYAPECAAVHDHRYTWEALLARERLVGRMAAKLWQANAECFRAVYENDLDERYLDFCRRAVAAERRRAPRLLELLGRYAQLRATELDNAPGGRAAFMSLLHGAIQPMKRLEFRRGLLEERAAGAPRTTAPTTTTTTAGLARSR
ncbi:MAG TPA: glycosyltransferase family 2 protein [Phycisphaerae bacterium]|nr:glycosyltransferase family 2 protein [Phycisphaerae bacterium]